MKSIIEDILGVIGFALMLAAGYVMLALFA